MTQRNILTPTNLFYRLKDMMNTIYDKITSKQLNEIRELLNDYLVDFNFRYNKNDIDNDRFIRFKVEIKGWKN